MGEVIHVGIDGVEHEIIADHPLETVEPSDLKTIVNEPSTAVDVIVPGLPVPRHEPAGHVVAFDPTPNPDEINGEAVEFPL